MVVAMSWWAVIISTGASAARFFSSGIRSMPDPSGSRMSSTMAEGGDCSAMRNPSAPVAAESTPKPRSSRCIESSSRMLRSSSTIRIRSIVPQHHNQIARLRPEGDGDDVADAVAFVHAGVALVLAGDAGDHREAEAGAAGTLRVEGDERVLAQFGRERAAGVGYRELPAAAGLADGDVDRAAADFFGGDRGLAAEDLHRRPDAHRIENHRRHPFRQLAHESDAAIRPLQL